jgi:O-antigen ligase
MITIRSKLLNAAVYYVFICLSLVVLFVPFNLLDIKIADVHFQYLYFGIFASIFMVLSFLQSPRLSNFDKWLIFLVLGFSLSLISSVNRIHTIRVLTGFFFKGIAIAFISERISKVRIKSTNVILIYSASIVALIGLVEIIYGRHMYRGPYEWIPQIISSTVGNPLPFAAYLVLFLPLSLWYIEDRKTIVRILPVFIITLGILFSFSRSGWISFLFAFIIYSLRNDFLKKISRKWIYIVPFIISISIFMLFMMPRSWQTQFEKFDIGMFNSKSVEHRLKSFITIKNIVNDYPLFGVGFGNYPQVHEKYMAEGVVKEAPSPDNMYLRLLADTGIVGGLVFLSFLVFWLFQLWKNRADIIIWAIFCGMIGFLINMLAADLFFWTIPQFSFWLLFGLGVNIINGISDKNR